MPLLQLGVSIGMVGYQGQNDRVSAIFLIDLAWTKAKTKGFRKTKFGGMEGEGAVTKKKNKETKMAKKWNYVWEGGPEKQENAYEKENFGKISNKQKWDLYH